MTNNFRVLIQKRYITHRIRGFEKCHPLSRGIAENHAQLVGCAVLPQTVAEKIDRQIAVFGYYTIHQNFGNFFR
jgi:hypothetical protein